jgi:hypothetical protein
VALCGSTGRDGVGDQATGRDAFEHLEMISPVRYVGEADSARVR